MDEAQELLDKLHARAGIAPIGTRFVTTEELSKFYTDPAFIPVYQYAFIPVYQYNTPDRPRIIDPREAGMYRGKKILIKDDGSKP